MNKKDYIRVADLIKRLAIKGESACLEIAQFSLCSVITYSQRSPTPNSS